MTESSTDNGKTIGIIAYLSLIGWIIALVMHSSNKTAFGAFHIRQMLGIMVVTFLLSILAGFLGISIISWIVQIAVIVYWLLGFIGAVQGEMKLVPMGAQFQDWFKGIG
tara:strand:+ start:234336 stop:234662 length:327 start_codon:yes stop_codon:yes gene_type:complete